MVVDGEPTRRCKRRRPHPRGPHHGRGGDRGAVAEADGAVLDRDESRVRPDLDAALAEPVGRVRRERAIELRQDPVRGLDHDPPHIVRDPGRIRGEGGPREVLELTDRLDPGEPGPDEDEPERGAPFLGVFGLGRSVELREHTVPKPDRLGQRLEPDAVLSEPRYRQGPRPRAGTDNGHVERLVPPAAVGQTDPRRPALRVDPLHLAQDEPRATERTPERHDDGAGVDQPARHFRQERLIRHVVLRAHHDQLVPARGQSPLEVAGRVQTDVAATDDQDPGHRLTFSPGPR